MEELHNLYYYSHHIYILLLKFYYYIKLKSHQIQHKLNLINKLLHLKIIMLPTAKKMIIEFPTVGIGYHADITYYLNA